MDLIESIKKNKAYNKYKLTVKTWEKDFKVKYSRTPSKHDIKDAPMNIKYAYKKYFQLKSAALENSLSICDIDEETLELSEPVPNIVNDSPYCLSPKSEQLVQSLPSGQELDNLINKIQENKEPKANPKALNYFTENLSKKLFQNRKFSLRNPRKLSISKSQASVSCDIKTHDKKNEQEIAKYDSQVSDKEKIHTNIITFNINSGNSTKIDILMNDSPNKLSVTSLSHNKKIRQVNDAWFERVTGLNITTNNENTTNIIDKYGMSNIKAPAAIEKIKDYVENSESDEENYSIGKLKPALKKRKVDVTDNFTHSKQEKLGFENIIDSKMTIGNKRNKRNTKITKIEDVSKAKQPLDFNEYVSFGLDKVTPRHSDLSRILKTVDMSSKLYKGNNVTDSLGTENLQNKINSGCLNDNFIKINIDKKIYVRGKKHTSFSSYKKQQWKNKKALHPRTEISDSNRTCFKCGVTGHMARYCTAHKGDSLLPLENYLDDNIPTLQDMQSNENNAPTLDDMQNSLSNILTLPKKSDMSIYEANEIPDSFINMLAVPKAQNSDIKPIYTEYQKETPKELHEALHLFGHKLFRPGQEPAIMRVLCGMSTLLILSTGGGKSLCYQLPAYIYSQKYKCITLVISPLVSLMEDQVISMPEFLKAGCLHSNQSPTQRQKIIQCLKDGNINILLISPEALISGDNSSGFLGLFKSLPQIAFACIDEIHCVSQWSHNFRPSYLMICRVLREKLNVKCILGLTATASQATIESVIDHIDIPDGTSGVITNPALPDNLYLSVSIEKDKDKALMTYLSTNPIKKFNSIVIYCIRRDECERVAAILRSSLQEQGKITMEINSKKRKRMSYIAEAYHAGMSAAQRKKIQKHFMDGTLRIIVATVAFGMGINKPDIRCIIHFNMPSNFESYVQEVGRAGRDGHAAYCHVFLNNNDNSDKNELLKHIYANSIDRPTVRKLLQKVFIPCECSRLQEGTSSNNSRCKGHEVGIPTETTVEELDLPSENIITLLCYLELHPKKYVKVLNNGYIMCKVLSYGGPQKILEATKTCPPLAMAYLLESRKDPDVMKKTVLEFNIIDVASAIGWESGMTKYHLKNLEWITNNRAAKRSQLKVEFNTLGFRIKALGDLIPTELDTMLDDLYETVQIQEKAKLYQLEESNNTFSKYGNYSLENGEISEHALLTKSNELKSTIRSYFQREKDISSDIKLKERPLNSEVITSDIRSLIATYKDCRFTSRSIARIFQGISSPNYPAITWGKCKFWRSHIHEDFNGLVKLATQQILQMKMS